MFLAFEAVEEFGGLFRRQPDAAAGRALSQQIGMTARRMQRDAGLASVDGGVQEHCPRHPRTAPGVRIVHALEPVGIEFEEANGRVGEVFFMPLAPRRNRKALLEDQIVRRILVKDIHVLRQRAFGRLADIKVDVEIGIESRPAPSPADGWRRRSRPSPAVAGPDNGGCRRGGTAPPGRVRPSQMQVRGVGGDAQRLRDKIGPEATLTVETNGALAIAPMRKNAQRGRAGQIPETQHAIPTALCQASRKSASVRKEAVQNCRKTTQTSVLSRSANSRAPHGFKVTVLPLGCSRSGRRALISR